MCGVQSKDLSERERPVVAACREQGLGARWGPRGRRDGREKGPVHNILSSPLLLRSDPRAGMAPGGWRSARCIVRLGLREGEIRAWDVSPRECQHAMTGGWAGCVYKAIAVLSLFWVFAVVVVVVLLFPLLLFVLLFFFLLLLPPSPFPSPPPHSPGLPFKGK